MNKSITLFPMSVLIAGFTLLGCSKSKHVQSPDKPKPAAGSSAEVQPDGSTELKIKWAVDKRYISHLELTQNTDLYTPKKSTPIKQVMRFGQDLAISAINDLPDGGKKLELRFDSQKIDIERDGKGVMNFDSSQETAPNAKNPYVTVFQKMIGGHISFLTDSDGKVQKVEGFDDFANQASDGGKPQLKKIFMSMFTEDTLKQYGSMAEAMPDHPVKPEDSWDVAKDVVTPGGLLSAKVKYTFKGWIQHGDHQCAHIIYDGTMTSQPSAAKQDYSMRDGKISGDAWFDPERGMVVDSEYDEDTTMETTVHGKKLLPKSTQKLSFKLIDVEDVK